MKYWRAFVAMVCSVALLLGMIPAIAVAEPAGEESTALSSADTAVDEGTLDVSSLTAEDILGEDETRREANVKHFKLTDGSMVAVSYPLSVHEEVDGAWEEIDNSLRPTTDADGDSVQKTASQNVTFSFVEGRGNQRLVKVEDTRSKAQIVFELVDADKKELILSEPADSEELFTVTKAVQKGTFKEILPDTDIEYIFAGTMLKENVVVKTPEAVRPIRFVLRCKNVSAALQEDQSVLFTDTDGAEVFSIPAPFMVDAAQAISDAVAVTLEPHQKGYVYTMTPSAAWTEDPDRVYPITIDPVVNNCSDHNKIHSAMVKESQPTAAAGSESYFWVGNNNEYSSCYSLLQFELPTLTAADYVIGGQMRLVSSLRGAVSGWAPWNDDYLDGSMVLTAHKINSAWNEDAVTWNTRPTFEPSVMDAVALKAKHAVRGEHGYVCLDVTEVVSEWYRGSAPNHGILMKLNDEGNHTFAAEFVADLWMMYPSDQVLGVQPHIYVAYRSKAGLEDHFSYTSVSAGTAGTGYVRLNSGSLTFVQEGLSLGDTVAPVSINHVYNSCNSGKNIGYGYGWTLSYAQTLKEVTLGARTYYAYTDADATVHYFDVTDAADEYEDEERLGFKLNAAKTKISDKNDTVWSFDTSGRLTSIKEAHGKEVTITYVSENRIASITDGLGRCFTLTYANGFLETVRSLDGRVMHCGYNEGRPTLQYITEGTGAGAPVKDRRYYTYSGKLLLTAEDEAGNHAEITYSGTGEAARVTKLRHRVASGEAKYTRAYTEIDYDLHHTTVTDQDGLAVTYQFDAYGLTRSVYNNHGRAQYFKHYAPNAQNPNGTSTYGVGKLEASSQTHYAVSNLLLEHGFELIETPLQTSTEAITYFEMWSGVPQRSVWEPQEGLHSLVFNNEASSSTKTVSQTIPAAKLTGGGAYTLSVQARVFRESGDDGATQMLVKTQDGTVLASHTVRREEAWHTEQVSFTLPAGNTSPLQVVFTKSGNGIGYFDSVQLEKKSTANRYNLLENSDLSRFYTNASKPFAWVSETDGGVGSVVINTTDAAPGELGLDAGHFRTAVSTADPTRVFFDTTLSQTVALGSQKKGSTLSYGGWMHVDPLPVPVGEDTDDTSKCGIRIELYDDEVLVQSAFIEANRYCEDWQFLGDVIVAKRPFSSAKVSFVYENNVNEARFDGAFLYADYFGQSFTYDDEGNVISTTAYADQKSTFEYTASDDLKTFVSPEGASYTYTYNDFHDVKTGTSAEGVTYAYRYDENKNSDTLGQVLSAQTVLGTAQNTAEVEYTYDGKFLAALKTSDARDKAVTQFFSDDGLLLKTEDATGVVTEYTYDTRDRVTAVKAAKNGKPLSTVTYTYDSADRLQEIRNGDVGYFFTYDAAGRVTRIAVGTSAATAVTLSATSYVDKAASNGYHSSQAAKQTYGNGDSVQYTYDELQRVVGVRYEGDTADRFTYTYDNEGCLTAVTDTESGVTVQYEYDLSKRLSRILQSDGYILTYEYNAENALVGVKESFGGVEKSTRYVYNKDNQITKAISPKDNEAYDKAVYYDYSYDRRVNWFDRAGFTDHAATYGFSSVNGVTVTTFTPADKDQCPVPTEKAVKLERTDTTADISNADTWGLASVAADHRYTLSFWYKATVDGEETENGILEAEIVSAVTKQTAVSEELIADGEWHYMVLPLTATGSLYSADNNKVYPTLRWKEAVANGTLILNGLHFSDAFETVFLPADLNRAAAGSHNVTTVIEDDNTAPMPSGTTAEWTSTGGDNAWIAVQGNASSTPQPGEIWEFTYYAKRVSGDRGKGIAVSFRGYAEDGTMVRDVIDGETSSVVTPLENDGWHTYKAYVTIAKDAYAYGHAVKAHIGWQAGTEAGVIRIGGVSARKVGNQWNNDAACMELGLVGNSLDENFTVTEADSADSPIAYQKTVKLAHSGTTYTRARPFPVSSFRQLGASDTWTVSFWAKATKNGSAAPSLQYVGADSPVPRSMSLHTDGRWRLYTLTLPAASLTNATRPQFNTPPGATLYLNGISLVPGATTLATESYQNSAALKNKTIDTGAVTFNTAIEYDTDANRTAYSRVKHFINQGKAISYSYDENGNISSIQSPDGSWVDYEYDDLNQLIAEHYSTAKPLASLVEGGGTANAVTEGVSYDTISYSYDPRGNLTEKTYSLNGETVDTVPYTYGNQDGVWADVLTSFDGVAIAYDQIGNPLNWHDGATLTWQHGRQLASYSKDGTSINYTYNADGIRTSKTVNGVTTTYNVVDGTLRRMSDGTNTLQFINGTSVIFNGVEYWYVFNALNDVIGIIDANGEYVVEYTYDAWGAPLSKTGELADTLGTLNPFRYRGYIYDEETGLYYVSSRYYDPVVGRWLNADNEALVIATPETPHWDKNLYAYCDNNPIIRMDTGGEFWWFIPIIVDVVVSVACEYVGDVIQNVNEGKTGWDVFTVRSSPGEYVAAVASGLCPGGPIVDNLVYEGVVITEKLIVGTEIDLVESAQNVVVGSLFDIGAANTAKAINGSVADLAPKNYSTYAGMQRHIDPNLSTTQIRTSFQSRNKLVNNLFGVTESVVDFAFGIMEELF